MPPFEEEEEALGRGRRGRILSPAPSLNREREDDSFRLDSTLPAEIIYHGNGT